MRAPARAPSRISPASSSSCAPASTWCTCRIAAPARRRWRCWKARCRSARSRSAAAEALIKDGQLKALAVTGADALVLAARRADHDRGRLSRLRLRHLQCAVRARRHATGDRGAAGAGKPGGDETPEAREQARKAGFEVVAGTPDQLAAPLAAEIPAVKELVRKGRHQTGVALNPRYAWRTNGGRVRIPRLT